jgi:hypothetical protein
VLFAAALVDLTIAAIRIGHNSRHLANAERAFAQLESPVAAAATLDRFLDALGLPRNAQDTLVVQRIRNLFRLRARRVLDVGVLKEISGERVSLHGGFSRFVAGTLTVLGLIGTVLGLTLAIDRLPSLAEQVKSSGEITTFLDQVLRTLGGMRTAFACTLTGLVSSVALSILNYAVQRWQAGFFVRLETFANAELVPAIVPAPPDHASEEFVRRLDDAGPRLTGILERVDQAVLVFCEGLATLATSTARMDESIARLTTGMDSLAASADALVTGTTALDDLRKLPQSLQQFLGEAMRGAAAAVEARQEKVATESLKRQEQASTEYLSRVDQFFREATASQQQLKESYADLILGVQTGVTELLTRIGDRHAREERP